MGSPFDMLQEALGEGAEVLVLLQDSRAVRARLKAYDRHFNLVLQEGAPDAPRTRFLRGDNVVFVERLPK